MEPVELFTIEDTFWLAGNQVQMLILSPSFSVPKGWKNRKEPVVVQKPDGQQMDATAEMSISHVNIPTSADLDKRWRIRIWLTDRTKEEVPVGSKILAAPDVKQALFAEPEWPSQ